MALLQINSIYLSQKNMLLECNFNFRKLIDAIRPEDLIKLYSCLLLEKKIVLLASDDSY